jgi:prepilin-type N-terminal cleavage/methylation domain-containing protein
MIIWRKPRNARALTIVEVLVAMAILGIIMTVALGLYLQGDTHFAKTSVDLDAEREARAAMGYTAGELRQAMPVYGVNSNPVVAPTAWSSGASPTPTAAVTFYKIEPGVGISGAVTGTTIDPTKLVYECVTIQTTPDPAIPASGPTNPPLLQETIYQPNCATVKETRIIGHDVATFAVTPLTAASYDIQIETAPIIRHDLQSTANPTFNTYTLNSTIFISYYQTNLK